MAYANTQYHEHNPVLRDAVVAALAIRADGIYVDGTFGRGGTTAAILAQGPRQVLAFDRDPQAIAAGQALTQRHPELTLIHARFGAMVDELQARAVTQVDGITFDLGVSSPQLDEAARGFSFGKDGPLDMRMDPALPRTAADFVNDLPERELADLIFTYGDEKYSRRIARAIVARRLERPFARTLELADLVRRQVPRSQDGLDPATRTFQALRILVNDELGELNQGLEAAETLLGPEGRLAVISFHALEDRIVKNFIRSRSAQSGGGVTRHRPMVAAARPSFQDLTKKPIAPDAAEIAINPRARSAKLRIASRLDDRSILKEING
jgi:16S rRNA (cytosine1402-N4)-methyltransferase